MSQQTHLCAFLHVCFIFALFPGTLAHCACPPTNPFRRQPALPPPAAPPCFSPLGAAPWMWRLSTTPCTRTRRCWCPAPTTVPTLMASSPRTVRAAAHAWGRTGRSPAARQRWGGAGGSLAVHEDAPYLFPSTSARAHPISRSPLPSHRSPHPCPALRYPSLPAHPPCMGRGGPPHAQARAAVPLQHRRHQLQRGRQHAHQPQLQRGGRAPGRGG